MEQTTWAGLRSPWLLEPVADSPLFICEPFLIDTAPFEIDMLAPFDIYSEDKMFICCQEKYQNLLELHVFLHLFVIKFFNYIKILANIKLIHAKGYVYVSFQNISDHKLLIYMKLERKLNRNPPVYIEANNLQM